MKSFLKWGALGVFSMGLMMGVTACSDDDTRITATLRLLQWHL